MLSRHLLIKNRLGLHARAAVKLVEIAQSFDAVIQLTNDENRQVTADGVIGLLMLNSAQGQYINVSAYGPEAKQALDAICELINSGFDEDK